MLEPPIAAKGERDDPSCLGAGEARRLLTGVRWRRMVVLGDGRAGRRPERVVGYDGTPWTARVAGALREVAPGAACLDLLGGQARQVAEVRSRQVPEALAFGGDLAVVHLTGHDLLRPGLDAGAVRTELVRIIAPLRERGYDVLWVDPFDLAHAPAARGADTAAVRARQRARTRQSRTLALRHGALHVDLSAGPPGAAAEVWGSTGTALNSRGHAVTAAAVVRALGDRTRRETKAVDAREPGPPGPPASA
ncbi:hypothetical protein ACFC0M_31110 [Streptomyces sp. NPDC056149]|uniref:hypothetical protein n=1 Tax=unclassified Streptomyces TaxID=2593676 RepID=UPI0023817C88|nr:hypothetical protein [Streptomyces sp. WZ-12]